MFLEAEDIKEDIEVELKPRPESDSDPDMIDRPRYVSIAKTASVDHITKYLSQVPKFPYESANNSLNNPTGISRTNSPDSQTQSDTVPCQNVQFNIYSYSPEWKQYTRIPGHILLSELDRNSEGFIVLFYQRVADEDEDYAFDIEE